MSEDDFVVYVEREEEKKKPKYKLTGDAKEALRDYYDAVHTLCDRKILLEALRFWKRK